MVEGGEGGGLGIPGEMLASKKLHTHRHRCVAGVLPGPLAPPFFPQAAEATGNAVKERQLLLGWGWGMDGVSVMAPRVG